MIWYAPVFLSLEHVLFYYWFLHETNKNFQKGYLFIAGEKAILPLLCCNSFV